MFDSRLGDLNVIAIVGGYGLYLVNLGIRAVFFDNHEGAGLADVLFKLAEKLFNGMHFKLAEKRFKPAENRLNRSITTKKDS